MGEDVIHKTYAQLSAHVATQGYLCLHEEFGITINCENFQRLSFSELNRMNQSPVYLIKLWRPTFIFGIFYQFKPSSKSANYFDDFKVISE